MAEPVSLEELKAHLDVDRDDQDEMITAMGVAAREWVESFTGLTLARRRVSEAFTNFGAVRALSAWPIAEDAVPTVRYSVGGTAPVVLDGATVFPLLRPCPIYPAPGSAWPHGAASVIVTIEAGYAPEDVPASLKSALKLMVGNLYANRESTVTGTIVADTGTIENLCRPYRLPVIG